MIGHYRPHGSLRWMIEQLPTIRSWDVIGALAAEKRSVAVPCELQQLGKLKSCRLLRITDCESIFEEDVQHALAERKREFDEILTNGYEVYDENLISDLPELEPLGDKLESGSSEHVILDISCLPKRFFFYLLRRLIQSSQIRTLLATVTIPDQYGNVLSVNSGRWEFLPSYGRERSDKAQPLLAIGVGYQHLNLLDLVEETAPDSVRLLFPFPSKPPGAIRNWEFVMRIEQEKKFRLKQCDVLRVHPQATSLAFDILAGQCGGRDDEVWLAPFGPKSISLAMVLFALACEAIGKSVSIGYTQPSAYSATYSTGIELDTHENPVIHTYCIKLEGRNWYSI